MADKTRTYENDDIRIHYDPVRCIHAARCVHGLRTVFDPDQRPWIDPTRATADEIAAVVATCPTGALQYERKDGGAPEGPADRNTVQIEPDGPVYLRGDITLQRADGTILGTEPRMALCRCGASTHKPFCDGKHAKVGFSDPGTVTREMSSERAPAGPLRVTPRVNGSVLLEGPFEVIDGAGNTVGSLGKAGLCRCGHSQNKPFCDGSHKAAGFVADE
jgi:CDGSH-type Zn-finger protein/uncharacterized Fe-S cluster protein YjdI